MGGGGKKASEAEVTIIRVSRMGDEGEAEEVAETNGRSPVFLSSPRAAAFCSVVAVYVSVDAVP